MEDGDSGTRGKLVTNATELYSYKWLKWWILHFVYFNTHTHTHTHPWCPGRREEENSFTNCSPSQALLLGMVCLRGHWIQGVKGVKWGVPSSGHSQWMAFLTRVPSTMLQAQARRKFRWKSKRSFKSPYGVKGSLPGHLWGWSVTAASPLGIVTALSAKANLSNLRIPN